MKLGFSTGSLHGSDVDKLSLKAIDIIRNTGSNAIELSALHYSEVDRWLEFERSMLDGFSFRSLHAPALNFQYKNDEETVLVLNSIRKLHERLGFHSIVLHPDRVLDWSIFRNYNDLPFAIENMDAAKNMGKTVQDLERLLKDGDFGMVLDLQHCYSNDPSMQLAADLYMEFGPQIVEIHLSGHGSNPSEHVPLYQTRQLEILRALPNHTTPIIIESPLQKSAQIIEEYRYVSKFLKNVN